MIRSSAIDLRRTALAILSVVLLVTPAWTAPPFSDDPDGVNGTERGIAGGYATIRSAGYGWVRVFLRWDKIQPTPDPPQFDLASIGANCNDWPKESARQIVDNAYNAGFSIVGVLTHAPKWANSPPTAEQFGAFAAAMATEFGDKVAVWELWNEPDFNAEFSGTPKAYRNRILIPGFDAIKAVRPDAKIAGPTLYTSGTATPDKTADPEPYLLENGRLVRPIDILTFHSYGEKKAIKKRIEKFHAFAVKHDIPEVWMTEYGWSLKGGEGPCSRCKSEEQCAELIDSPFALIERNEFPRFKRFFNFSMHDRNKANCVKGCRYGLLDAEGKPRARLTMP
jgi:hypothetical protein